MRATETGLNFIRTVVDKNPIDPTWAILLPEPPASRGFQP